MRGINKTRETLRDKYDGDFSKISLSDFNTKKMINDLSEGYMGTKAE